MTLDLLVVDLDNTLYAADNGVFARMDKRMVAFISKALNISADHADALRIKYWRAYGSTLRGLMLHHGVEAELFLHDVHDVQAEELLALDEPLHHSLSQLTVRKVIHTNGTSEHAERILQALGVRHHFEAIYDIRYRDYMPKPCAVTLELLLKQEGVSPSRALVVDDMADNLMAAKEIGAQTCWVSKLYQQQHDWDYAAASVECLPTVLKEVMH